MAENCCAQVSARGGWHHYQCSRKGVIERDGKWYCRQHDPPVAKARQAAARKRDKDKFEADIAARDAVRNYPKVLAELAALRLQLRQAQEVNDNLQKLLVRIAVEINTFQDVVGWQKGESRNRLIGDISRKIERMIAVTFGAPPPGDQSCPKPADQKR